MSASVPDNDRLTVLFSRLEIATAVERLASEVRRDYSPIPRPFESAQGRQAQALLQAQGERDGEPQTLDLSPGFEGVSHRGELVEPRTTEPTPLLIGILRGAFVFMADLVRALDMPVTVDFLRISTYGSGTRSSGRPRIVQGVRSPIRGRHVLVVEDIVDTGLTTRFLLDYLKKSGAASARLCAMLSKPSRRQVNVEIDYLGFTVPDLFVVGYGLDFAQKYRWLPDICVLEDK